MSVFINIASVSKTKLKISTSQFWVLPPSLYVQASKLFEPVNQCQHPNFITEEKIKPQQAVGHLTRTVYKPQPRASSYLFMQFSFFTSYLGMLSQMYSMNIHVHKTFYLQCFSQKVLS